MSYDVIATPKFRQALKRLIKKIPSLKKEFAVLIENLEKEPFSGTPLGHNCYKIRLAIASKGKGKSRGARVITHIMIDAESVYLLTLYDKSEKDDLSDKELEMLLSQFQD